MEVINLLIGVLGLFLGIIGFYFTYISFINPIIRFRKYLKNTEGWEFFLGSEMHLSIYRHKKYPNFQIVIDWDKEVVSNFQESWIMDYPWKNNDNNSSYQVRLEVGGMLLQTELFLSMDGHRYFIPVPRRQSIIEDEQFFYYDGIQIQLVKIVGRFDFYKDIYEFTAQQKNLSINESI